MKAKIMALVLAVGLGVTGVAVTAQAAKEVAGCGDPDWYKTIKIEFAYADYCNAQGHYSTYKKTTTCNFCGNESNSTYYTFEAHDYEQVFEANGRVKLVCSACKDSYYQ